MNAILVPVTRALQLILVLSLAATTLLATEQRVVLSNVYPIVKKYKSMEGPYGSQVVYLGDRDNPELLWLTAIRTEVVGEDGKTKKSPELMCHMNVDIDPARHKALFNLQRLPPSRLMTISQGMRVPGGGFEARLPDGFGFPIASNEPLLVMTQVLNHNIEHPQSLKVRHRVTFEFVRDRDLQKRPVPLFNLPVTGMVQMSDNPLALAAGMGGMDHAGASCLVGTRAPNAMGMASDYVDPQGRHMTGHWVVPPGKQVNASDATWFMNLPYDTKLHYAAVHLHPFAQSLTLRDTTAGLDLFKARATNPKHRVGLEHVDAFVSIDGVPMYRDHKYEMVSVYDNPTKQNADSMASMFLAVDDPEFAAPTPAELAERATILADAVAVILRTSAGDIGAMLLRDQAPQTVLQFARLISAGAFRGAAGTVNDSSIAFTIALNDDFRRLLRPVAGETRGEPHPGAISLCTTEADASFVIATRTSPGLDSHCTVVGQIGPGSEVVRAITAAGAQLLRGEIMSATDLQDLHLAPAKRVASR